jgi:hypothetical protein
MMPSQFREHRPSSVPCLSSCFLVQALPEAQCGQAENDYGKYAKSYHIIPEEADAYALQHDSPYDIEEVGKRYGISDQFDHHWHCFPGEHKSGKEDTGEHHNDHEHHGLHLIAGKSGNQHPDGKGAVDEQEAQDQEQQQTAGRIYAEPKGT